MHIKLQSGNLECDLGIDWNIIRLKMGFTKQNTRVRNGLRPVQWRALVETGIKLRVA
jgi:hypothetical protein